MKKAIVLGVACLVAQAGLSVSWAQSRAWRCPGNYYTSSASEAKEIGGCQALDGSNITVINSGRSSSYSSPAQGAQPNAGVARVNPPPTGAAPAPRYVPSVEQQGRDAGARTLLEQELNNRQSELTLLQREYNNGRPERMISEAQDDSLYQSRVERLGRDIEQKRADINAIQNELSRLR